MLLIKNGKIMTMSDAILSNGCVLVDDGRIREIAPDIPAKSCEVLDACGGWVTPGFIDAHSHIGITEEKVGHVGDDCNETNSPLTPGLRALDAFNPMDSALKNAVAAGITGVLAGPGSSNIIGGQFAYFKTDGRIADRMCVKQPAALKAAFGENPKTQYGCNAMPSTRMSIAYMLRKALMQARQYSARKSAAEADGSSFEQDIDMESYMPVLNKQIPLKMHVHRADDILTALRIAREFDVSLTLDHCTEGHLIAGVIAESGFPAIIGPSMVSRNKREVQYMDFKTPGILADAGVLIALTTDHPVSRIEYLPICAGLAARDGLGMERALKAITINAATICGVADRVGSLEVGKDADIAVFNGNPLEVFTKTLYTLIDGRLCYDHRKT